VESGEGAAALSEMGGLFFAEASKGSLCAEEMGEGEPAARSTLALMRSGEWEVGSGGQGGRT
jgi:hypothetical protein